MKPNRTVLSTALLPTDNVVFGHKGLAHLVEQMSAQGAHTVVRLDPKHGVLIARFAFEPYDLPRRQRATENPLASWVPIAKLKRIAVNGWLCEMIGGHDLPVPSRIDLEFRIRADLANAIHTTIMLQHAIGLNFGDQVNAFLDWSEGSLISGDYRDGEDVSFLVELDLQGWAMLANWQRPVMESRDDQRARAQVSERLLAF